MKRILAVLVAFAATVAAFAAPGGLGFGFSRTSTITTTASSVTIPTCPNSGAPPGHVKLRAPASNSDVVYVRAEGTATSADLSLTPGGAEEVSMAGTTLSVLAASGTQAIDVIASCGSRPR